MSSITLNTSFLRNHREGVCLYTSWLRKFLQQFCRLFANDIYDIAIDNSHVGLQKIDCNRYSIFYPFLSSKIPKSLLFYSSIEYAIFFTFLALVSIFFIRFFLGTIRLNPSKRLNVQMAFILKLILPLITGVGSPSPQYPQTHGSRALWNRPHILGLMQWRNQGLCRPGRIEKLPPRISQKNFLTSSSYESMTIYLK